RPRATRRRPYFLICPPTCAGAPPTCDTRFCRRAFCRRARLGRIAPRLALFRPWSPQPMRDLPLTARTRLAIGLGLALLLAGTRLQPFAAALHVSEDASWSVFFLAGALLGGSVPLL